MLIRLGVAKFLDQAIVYRVGCPSAVIVARLSHRFDICPITVLLFGDSIAHERGERKSGSLRQPGSCWTCIDFWTLDSYMNIPGCLA